MKFVDFYPAFFLYQTEIHLNNLQNSQAALGLSIASSSLPSLKVRTTGTLEDENAITLDKYPYMASFCSSRMQP